ncbi:SRPBCC family protein [Saccharomonospora iraqiensis]|uniref:SRPBCC family protein n=1 Tax=Saccharomonospora iraqiensis TaxID=52698 RepID=UPI000416C4D7|nr:SRPBCC family protein [Saccharomonospora iraqiensis]
MSAHETTTTRGTTIEAVDGLPAVRIVREFAAARQRVFAAWTDPDLVARWIGPRDLELRIDGWDPRTGGHWRYSNWRGGEHVASFYGSFHEVRPPERIVQTFTWTDLPDGVSLETAVFDDLGGSRTRVTVTSLVDTLEARDAMLGSGMEVGVREGYEKLDALLR